MLNKIISFITKYKIAMIIVLIIALLLSIFLILKNKNKESKISVKEMTLLGIFGALSGILYYLKFNLPAIFPEFLEINLSFLPIMIIALFYGKSSAYIVVIIRTLLKIPSTSTLFVGEICDMFIGIAVSFVISITKTKLNKDIISIIFGVVTWVVMAIVINIFINIPLYTALYLDGSIERFVNAISIINGVNKDNYVIKYIIFAVIPFNLVLSNVVLWLGYIIFKYLSKSIYGMKKGI